MIDELTALPVLPPKRYVRGKFELWFFIQFLEKLMEALKKIKINGEATLQVKMKPQPGEDTAIAILAPRLQIPASLDAFLTRHIGHGALSTSG